MNERLLRLVSRFFPEAVQVDTEIQGLAVVSVLGTLYALPLALAGLVWLVWVTNWGDWWRPELAWVWPMLLLLRWLYGRLDFSTLFEDDAVRVHGALGRLVIWSGVLLWGPAVLWLELLHGVADVVWHWWDVAPTPFMRKLWRWSAIRFILMSTARETLSILPALGLYARWGAVQHGPVLPGLTFPAMLPALYATLSKSGLFVLLMVPTLVIFMVGVKRPSLLDSLRTFVRFWLAVLIFYLLPDPFGVLAAGMYGSSGLWAYLFFIGGLLLFGFLAYRLSQIALGHQKQARELLQLEQLSRDLLFQPVADVQVAALLQAHLPELLPYHWLEVRLFPDEVLYRSDRDSPLRASVTSGGMLRPFLAESTWTQLADSTEPYLLLRQINPGVSLDGLLMPIIHPQDEARMGGICALPYSSDEYAIDSLPTLRSLASLLAALFYQKAHFQTMLESQAQAYKQEVYAQAYQAEVYAQALAYQKMTQELVLAGQIQASFLPQQLPDIVGWQMAVTLEPARETSGDFYDVIELGNGRIGLLIADVADKGIGPALYMALSRTLIRIFADQYQAEPHKVLSAANRRILSDTVNDLFVTVFYGVLDPMTGEMVYCNAGHNPPFVIQAQNGRAAFPLTRTAIPLGIMEQEDWGQGHVSLLPGDVLILYTDGVTEAQDEFEAFFGEERLQAVVRAHLDRPAEVIEDKIVMAIDDFVGDAPQIDDITLMVVIREGEAG